MKDNGELGKLTGQGGIRVSKIAQLVGLDLIHNQP